MERSLGDERAQEEPRERSRGSRSGTWIFGALLPAEWRDGPRDIASSRLCARDVASEAYRLHSWLSRRHEGGDTYRLRAEKETLPRVIA